MKKIIGLNILTASLVLAACGGTGAANAEGKKDSVNSLAMDTTKAASYSVAMVDNKKDPTCGMPVTAGIGDTAHYDGHTLGFCSAECKAEFLKNPKAGLAAAELK
jgi:YHS domain-containing protein